MNLFITFVIVSFLVDTWGKFFSCLYEWQLSLEVWIKSERGHHIVFCYGFLLKGSDSPCQLFLKSTKLSDFYELK